MNILDQSLNAPSGSDEKESVIQVGEFPPTDEQHDIIDAALNTEDNLLIQALAGAAKTSTLVMIANQPKMKRIPTLCLAFNKKNATDMAEALPPNCQSLTLNSIGHRTWSRSIGARCKPNIKKNFFLLSAYVKEQRKDVQDALWDSFADILDIVRKGKSAGWVPDNCPRHAKLRIFDSDEKFFSTLDTEPSNLQEQTAIRIMNDSIEKSYKGDIDFDDQIYMPTLFASSFPSFPLVMVDEAQDLSPLNHEMLAQIVRNERLFAVGDPCQAIYAFRGASDNSMSLMRKRFEPMSRYTLSISFRCSKAVRNEARWRAPHMKSPEWATEGSVYEFSQWSVDDIPPSAVVLCRNNAPIYAMAIQFLKAGKSSKIVGNDLGKNVVKSLTKLGEPHMKTQEVYKAIDAWEEVKLSRTRPHAHRSVRDLAACLRVFAGHGDNLESIIAYAKSIMYMEGQLLLMTGHKSKGLEFKDVFILDKFLCDVDDPKSQDRNVLYVMQTRSQDNLSYIKSEAYEGDV